MGGVTFWLPLPLSLLKLPNVIGVQTPLPDKDLYPNHILRVIRTFSFFPLKLIFVDLKPDPVDILGIAKITRSPSDSSLGPWFYVNARRDRFNVEVS